MRYVGVCPLCWSEGRIQKDCSNCKGEGTVDGSPNPSKKEGIKK